MLDLDHNDRIKKTYHKLLSQHGPFSSRSIAWNSLSSQAIRFKILTEIGNVKHQSLLDIGSGLGDLYNYLKPFSVDYTGIELSSEFTEASREKYPDIQVINDDFMIHIFQKKYDWVFCSGAFNAKIDDSDTKTKELLFAGIQKMWELTKKGLAFNLPDVHSDVSKENVPLDEEFNIFIYYYDPDEIVKFCKTITHNVVLKTGYLPHDFTIYMYV